MRKARLIRLLFLMLSLMLVAVACGSSGSSGGGDGGSSNGHSNPPASTYTVGGTVSGLVGTVVLKDNGGDDLTVSADGAFTFGTAVADGAAYLVTIGTQPAGQSCTVNSGTGIISGANVTNVSVICSANAYTVGGTVSGLSGTLVLKDNGADDLTVSADGAFTFGTAVADGAAYFVTVGTQPAGQFCTVNSGTGTISDANVVNVSVTCANSHWTYPSSLTDNISPDGPYAEEHRVAMDDNGNAIITWKQFDGSLTQIFKAEYRGGVWTYPSSLTDFISPDGGYAAAPQVAMDDNGNAIITWEQLNGSDWQIFKAEYRGGVWTYPSSLTDNISPDGEDATVPQVAMDDNGNAIITWTQYSGATSYIFKAEYRGGVWTYPSSLTDYIGPGGTDPHIAMDDNGNAIIAWMMTDGSSEWQIFKAEYRGGVWTYPSSLADFISPDGQSAATEPHVAMDNSGNAIIMWQQYDGANYQIFKAEYRSGAWTYPTSMTDNISPDGQDATHPELAMDNNGGAIIVWRQSDGTRLRIFKTEYRGGVWINPSSLSDHISQDGQFVDAPQVAMDDNGNAIITWEQFDGTYWQIFKIEYRGGVWTSPSPFVVNIIPSWYLAISPEVAMDNNGNAIITWQQSDGSNYQIFKAEYR